MERRERGFLGRLLVFLLSALAVVGLIAMTLSVLCPYLRPASFVWLAYFGLAFWEILAFNVVVFVLLLLMWSRRVWIAVLALVISIPGINKSYAFGSKTESSDSFKVMSYNVHYFRHLNTELKKDEFANQVVNLVREQSPDVVCLQEFRPYISGKKHHYCIVEFAKSIGFPYVCYVRQNTFEGNVIFSKYPLTDVSEDFGMTKGFGVMAYVDAGERGGFYLANVHLVSYNLTDQELGVLVNPAEQHNLLDTVGVTVFRKLKYGAQRRSEQIDNVLQELPYADGPVVVCGDFNETPVSYVYRRMQKAGFSDSFIKVGRGIKPTYAGSLPLLRIDYAWVNGNVTPLSFQRIRHKASDHYPIVMKFSVDKSVAKPAMKPVESNTDNSEHKDKQSINTELI